ncbi:DUF1958 domain-containing protein [Staphylococcus chromogenes]|uniref:DUF1958 domain-containing protein n=1 Tax=Staphylococcus chromogenes TaxID=46126 RepID=UPI003EBFCA73
MYKFFYSLVIITFIFTNITFKATAIENSTDLDNDTIVVGNLKPKSMLVTAQNGQILYEFNKGKRVDPASTTKLLTLSLIYEKIYNGDINLNHKVKIIREYEKLSKIPNLSNFPLEEGETYTIEQLIKQSALESSNASSIILSEYFAQDSLKFTRDMNKKAAILGMNNSFFTNPTGADNEMLYPYFPKKYKGKSKSITTAYDMAILTHYIIKKQSKILNVTKLPEDKQNNKILHNTNSSLMGEQYGFCGVDGLKTGTSENGYNLILTCKRNNLRINTFLFNIGQYPSDEAKRARHLISNKLLENTYKHYEYKKIMSKGRNKINGSYYIVESDLYDLVPKNMKKINYNISNRNELSVSYPRVFLKGCKPNNVKVHK